MTGRGTVTTCFNLATSTDKTLGDDIRRVQPTRCNVSRFVYFSKTLYMFRTVFPSIIRSSKQHIERQVFVCIVLDDWYAGAYAPAYETVIQYNTDQYYYLPLAWPGRQKVAVLV